MSGCNPENIKTNVLADKVAKFVEYITILEEEGVYIAGECWT